MSRPKNTAVSNFTEIKGGEKVQRVVVVDDGYDKKGVLASIRQTFAGVPDMYEVLTWLDFNDAAQEAAAEKAIVYVFVRATPAHVKGANVSNLSTIVVCPDPKFDNDWPEDVSIVRHAEDTCFKIIRVTDAQIIRASARVKLTENPNLPPGSAAMEQASRSLDRLTPGYFAKKVAPNIALT